jgi:predicted CoA-binding protein
MKESKRTLVLGASNKPERYAYKAMEMLYNAGIPFVAVGNKEVEVLGQIIRKDLPNDAIHTVTLYLSAQNQASYEQQIIDLKPQRVIFNPGTENVYFQQKLRDSDIEFEEACTLVLLSTGAY